MVYIMVQKRIYYHCEVCGKLWKWKALAAACESNVLPPPVANKGDVIRLKSDDGDYVNALVTEVTIRPLYRSYHIDPGPEEKVEELVVDLSRRGWHQRFYEVAAPCELALQPNDYGLCPIYTEGGIRELMEKNVENK